MQLASSWHHRPHHDTLEGEQTCIPCAGKGAFSLIELMVVVSIVGLLLALATPSLLTMGPNRKKAIHEVAGQLALARAEALMKQRPVYVVFATEALGGPSQKADEPVVGRGVDRPAPSDQGSRPH